MKLYMKFFGIQLKGAMQYKLSFILITIGQFLTSFNVFLGILCLLNRFHTVKGYSFREVILCFSTVLMAYTLAEMFMRGFDLFASTIGNGEFDRILLRPRGIILQVVSGKMEFTRIGRLLQAIIMFIYGITASEVTWNATKVFTIIMMVIGGAIVFGSLFILYASICFFTLEGLEFMNILTDGAREFGKYPLDIYGKGVLKFCTFVVPYALFQYYPLLYITGHSKCTFFMFYPVLCCLFLLPTLFLWRIGVRHYKSTGS